MKRRILVLIVSFTMAALLVVPLFAQEAEAQDEEATVITFEQPILITSIGQSSGAMMAKVLAQKAGLSFIYEQRANIEALDEAKTLIVVLGVSGKGLGAAGVDIDAEIAWATELFDRAKELEIPIIAMHIEGGARRGPMSDQINTLFSPQSDYLVIKEAGNEDGLFTEIATENEIPMVLVDTTLGVVPILEELFPIEEEAGGSTDGA
ncbi:hypothetical protein KAX17_12040 [Candidatus Bipolaricaulota bacterium]|nr:hypothetical protein [Candidatus Bipolaricaulota bacterium]